MTSDDPPEVHLRTGRCEFHHWLIPGELAAYIWLGWDRP